MVVLVVEVIFKSGFLNDTGFSRDLADLKMFDEV